MLKEELSWECYFMKLAHAIKCKSRDPKTKRGGVLVTDTNKIASSGFNDVPKEDNSSIEWCNREFLDYFEISAESNCILNAEPTTDFSTTTLYLTHSPHAHNIKLLAGSGIKKIIYDHSCNDIAFVKNICNYFLIDLVKYKPRDKVLIGTNSY